MLDCHFSIDEARHIKEGLHGDGSICRQHKASVALSCFIALGSSSTVICMSLVDLLTFVLNSFVPEGTLYDKGRITSGVKSLVRIQKCSTSVCDGSALHCFRQPTNCFCTIA